MLIVSVLFMVIILIYILSNYNNKLTYVMSGYFIVATYLMIIAVIYSSRISQYNYAISLDYKIYLYISKLKIPFSLVSRLYSFGFVLIEVMSVIFLKLFTKFKNRNTVLLFIPIIFFFIWTDYGTGQEIYLFLCNNQYVSIEFVKNWGNIVFKTLFEIYLFAPMFFIIKGYIQTKIFVKKRHYMIIIICIALFDIFIMSTFVYGNFSNLFFANVGLLKVPVYGTSGNSIITSMLTLCLLWIIVFPLLFFKPFGADNFFYKSRHVKTAKMFNKNMGMMLHIYKNAFLMFGQQFNLILTSNKQNNKEAVAKYSEIGLAASEEYMEMIKRMMGLLQGVKTKNTPVCLNECLDHAIRTTIHNDEIVYTKNYDSIIITVYGDKNHLTESFVNLLINAVNAAQAADRKPEITINAIAESDYYLIEIVDNGIGIPKNKYRQIFEPFYTTKQRSKYGGIGLGYVKNIVRIHGGEIRVRSKINKYTTFQIALPVYQADEKERFKW